jgi:hypothetical protein
VLTGSCVFAPVDIMKPGATMEARVDMYKGSMRLAVDKWGAEGCRGPVLLQGQGGQQHVLDRV